MTQTLGAEFASRHVRQDLFAPYRAQTVNPDGSLNLWLPQQRKILGYGQGTVLFKRVFATSRPHSDGNTEAELEAGVHKNELPLSPAIFSDPVTHESTLFQGYLRRIIYRPPSDSQSDPLSSKPPLEDAYEAEVQRRDPAGVPGQAQSFSTVALLLTHKPGNVVQMGALLQPDLSLRPVSMQRDIEVITAFGDMLIQLLSQSEFSD